MFMASQMRLLTPSGAQVARKRLSQRTKQMMKFAIFATLAITLSGCLESSSGASVARLDTLSSSCGNPNMQTLNGLPMRCGPQVASPYTFQ